MKAQVFIGANTAFNHRSIETASEHVKQLLQLGKEAVLVTEAPYDGYWLKHYIPGITPVADKHDEFHTVSIALGRIFNHD